MQLRFRFCLVLAVVFVFDLSFITLCAQAQSPATLTGTLTDPSGAAVAGAEVSAQRLPVTASAGLLRTTSSREGHFVLSLAPGRYRIRVAHT